MRPPRHTPDAPTDAFSSKQIAQKLLNQIRDGLQAYNSRKMLAAFDREGMQGYLAFQDQVEAFFAQYESFRVAIRLEESSFEQDKGTATASFQLEGIPRYGGPAMRREGELIFEFSRTPKRLEDTRRESAKFLLMTNIKTEPEAVKREYPDRPIVGVGGVVVQNGRVVLVRRAKAPRKGEWSIPGGMLELGETLRDGVAARDRRGNRIEGEERRRCSTSSTASSSTRTERRSTTTCWLTTSARSSEVNCRAASDVSEARWATLEEVVSLVKREMTVDVIRKGTRQGRR